MLQLDIQGAQRFAGVPTRATLRRWVLLALGAAGDKAGDSAGEKACNKACNEARLTLRFVGSAEGRRLNHDYRGRNYATNVLTFDYTRRPLAADIVLCMPVVAREAREHGKTLRAHLAHLVIHGVLHARGFDHEQRRQATAMEARERALLAQLRITDPYGPIVPANSTRPAPHARTAQQK
ncbi:MAG: rRNA maturation RNase YbeY [Betaproteobacteria bacterium]